MRSRSRRSSSKANEIPSGCHPLAGGAWLCTCPATTASRQTSMRWLTRCEPGFPASSRRRPEQHRASEVSRRATAPSRPRTTGAPRGGAPGKQACKPDSPQGRPSGGRKAAQRRRNEETVDLRLRLCVSASIWRPIRNLGGGSRGPFAVATPLLGVLVTLLFVAARTSPGDVSGVSHRRIHGARVSSAGSQAEARLRVCAGSVSQSGDDRRWSHRTALVSRRTIWHSRVSAAKRVERSAEDGARTFTWRRTCERVW
jgi:hypothetical protein